MPGKLAELTPPLVAILRGLEPFEAVGIGGAIVDAGFPALEVPLNSPDPLGSIRLLADALGHRALIGAGTVLNAAEVGQVAEAGGRLIVSPNCDPEVIRAAKAQGLICLPGVFTASEAFQALAAGADGLKIFPASVMGAGGIAALRAVLPRGTLVFGVGGVGPGEFAAYRAAGCDGFGVGGALYRPGAERDSVASAAEALCRAWEDSGG